MFRRLKSVKLATPPNTPFIYHVEESLISGKVSLACVESMLTATPH